MTEKKLVRFFKFFFYLFLASFLALGCGTQSDPYEKIRDWYNTVQSWPDDLLNEIPDPEDWVDLQSFSDPQYVGFGIYLDRERLSRFKDAAIPEVLEIFEKEGVRVIRVNRLAPGRKNVTISEEYVTSESGELADYMSSYNAMGIYFPQFNNTIMNSVPAFLKENKPTIGLFKNVTKETVLHEYLHHLIYEFHAVKENGLSLYTRKILEKNILAMRFKDIETEFLALREKRSRGVSLFQSEWEEKYLNYLVGLFNEYKNIAFHEKSHFIINQFLFDNLYEVGLEVSDILGLFQNFEIAYRRVEASLEKLTQEVQKVHNSLSKESYSPTFQTEFKKIHAEVLDFKNNSSFEKEKLRFYEWYVRVKKGYPRILISF
ncbi:MAG: hypothetical protein HYW47_01240 [Deltaproteobacteria bacterium]|nr:hypothetical protein [Deltaproteobacteria bacterium]